MGLEPMISTLRVRLATHYAMPPLNPHGNLYKILLYVSFTLSMPLLGCSDHQFICNSTN